MRLTQKRLDLTSSKHRREYLANMRRISGNDTVEEECYFLLDFLIKVYPESIKEVMMFLQDCFDFYSENAEYEKSEMKLIEQNLPLEIF